VIHLNAPSAKERRTPTANPTYSQHRLISGGSLGQIGPILASIQIDNLCYFGGFQEKHEVFGSKTPQYPIHTGFNLNHVGTFAVILEFQAVRLEKTVFRL